MPLYFFDTTGPGGECEDEVGTMLADLNAAQRLARRALCDIAGDCRDQDDIVFAVRVRDEAGTEVYRAIITLTEPPPFTAGLSAERGRLAPSSDTSGCYP